MFSVYILEFDYVKSEKPFFEDVKPSVEVSDESSAKPKNKRPSLLAGYKNTWRAFQTHHFHRYTTLTFILVYTIT